MPSAELIAIGTELLLGEILDTNTRFLARQLRDLGVDLYRATMIGDNEERIAGAIREALQRSQIVITTGGLGPTVDDPTRQAVARAMGVENIFQQELWEQIQNRFQRYGRVATGNNLRQAYAPQGAVLIENPVGTAPAFICEESDRCVACLPGVPREMEYLFQNAIGPYLREHYRLTGIIKARVLHSAGMGESLIDDLIGDLEQLPNPTVGLLAHPGQVDIRITVKAESIAEADDKIAALESEIRRRLGENVYGADADTVESVLRTRLASLGWDLSAYECNLNGELRARLEKTGFAATQVESGNGSCLPEEIDHQMELLAEHSHSRILLVANLQPGSERQVLTAACRIGDRTEFITRYYGGPPQHGPTWSANTALDFLRREINLAATH